MPKSPRKGVCLDTSFLITLCSDRRPNHGVARQCFQLWLERGVPMFLPTVAYAEFLAKDTEVPPYILNQMHLLAFDPESAVLAGKIERARLLSSTDTSTPRDAMKDDIKIIANACQTRVLGIATEDENSMVRFVRRAAKNIPEAEGLTTLLLSRGFDESAALFAGPTLPLVFDS